MTTAEVRARRRSRTASRSSAHMIRKPIARMSARPTVPAKFQCTFSKVTQKIVARNRKRVTFTRCS